MMANLGANGYHLVVLRSADYFKMAGQRKSQILFVSTALDSGTVFQVHSDHLHKCQMIFFGLMSSSGQGYEFSHLSRFSLRQMNTLNYSKSGSNYAHCPNVTWLILLIRTISK